MCAVFAELAFINVEFGGEQFWVLVAVDFVMLVMRDVRIELGAPSSGCIEHA
jgi:hypothetical protein